MVTGWQDLLANVAECSSRMVVRGAAYGVSVVRGVGERVRLAVCEGSRDGSEVQDFGLRRRDRGEGAREEEFGEHVGGCVRVDEDCMDSRVSWVRRKQ